jgi:hypothetical protein
MRCPFKLPCGIGEARWRSLAPRATNDWRTIGSSEIVSRLPADEFSLTARDVVDWLDATMV